MTSPSIYCSDVMVDIETTGTRPDRHAILQIAAVRFNFDRKQIDTQNIFDRSLCIPPWRSWAEDTREWWMKQPHVLEDIQSRAIDPANVMQEFFEWSLEYPGVRFWAKPTTFDFMFIAGYFDDFGLANPYSYRHAQDLNSFVRGLYRGKEVPEVVLGNYGDAHNAKIDCLLQLDFLFQHMEKCHESQ